jgi:hypothetical protein
MLYDNHSGMKTVARCYICMEETTNRFLNFVLLISYIKHILPDPAIVASASDIFTPFSSS